MAEALGWPPKSRRKRPNGYWDDPGNMRRGIDEFIEEQGMDAGKCLFGYLRMLYAVVSPGDMRALSICSRTRAGTRTHLFTLDWHDTFWSLLDP